MIFMTPQNGYKIIWAKTVFALLEIIAAVLVIIGCLAISGAALEHISGVGIGYFLNWLKTSNIGSGTIVGYSAIGLLQIMVQLINRNTCRDGEPCNDAEQKLQLACCVAYVLRARHCC